jgi:hypothetical protein
MKTRVLIYISVTISALSALVYQQVPNLARAAAGCTGVPTVIYVRGSGQEIDGREKKALMANLDDRLDAAKYNLVELDEDVQGSSGYIYPAVPVSGSKEGFRDGAIAVLSAASVGAYAQSIIQGKELLISHLLHGYSDPDQCWALVGYSQGAHVVGDALADDRLKSLRDHIVYVGMFGDPKYNMWGYDIIPTKNLPWYRGDQMPMYVPGVQAGGILQPRLFPDYVPRSSVDTTRMFTEVGSWCYNDDIICSGNVMGATNNAHGQYPERAYTQMTSELVNAMTDAYGVGILKPVQKWCTVQDVVILASTTPTVRRDGGVYVDWAIKNLTNNLFEGQCDMRVAVLGFGRPGKEPIEVLQNFEPSKSQLESTLVSLGRPSYPLDQTPDAIENVEMVAALDRATQFDWRENARKAVIVISDSGDVASPVMDYFGRKRVDISALSAQPAYRQFIQHSRAKGGVTVYGAPVAHIRGWDYPRDLSTVLVADDYLQLPAGETGGIVLWHRTCGASCVWSELAAGQLITQLLYPPFITAPSITVKSGDKIKNIYNDASGGEIAKMKRNGVPTVVNFNYDCEGLGQSGDVQDGDMVTIGAPRECYGIAYAYFDLPGVCNICGSLTNTGARMAAPFKIKVLPADYQPKPRPTKPTSLKVVRNKVAKTAKVTWKKPANAEVADKTKYKIVDGDGSLLGLSDDEALELTDISVLQPLPAIKIVPVNDTGDGEAADVPDAIDDTPADETPPATDASGGQGAVTPPTDQTPPTGNTGGGAGSADGSTGNPSTGGDTPSSNDGGTSQQPAVDTHTPASHDDATLQPVANISGGNIEGTNRTPVATPSPQSAVLGATISLLTSGNMPLTVTDSPVLQSRILDVADRSSSERRVYVFDIVPALYSPAGIAMIVVVLMSILLASTRGRLYRRHGVTAMYVR